MTIGTTTTRTVRFDHDGRAVLDGTWDLFPGDQELAALAEASPHPIRVPALWEAEGHLELDGVAWYRCLFRLEALLPHASLRFGAVMDVADVYLNGTFLGTHESAFTPFSFDVGGVLCDGDNELAVRVFDPAVDDPEHVRLAHGKQGWANWVFPSRPSLYMTYGGIWQSVELRRHGPLVVDDVFVNGDPDDLVVAIELRNVSDREQVGRLSVRALGRIDEREIGVDPGDGVRIDVAFGRVDAPRWSPNHPALHEALVDVAVGGSPSDVRMVRFGLRTVRIEGTRFLLNGVPYRMKSALVQGFRADGLYDEGSRADIEREVRSAREMGFTMLRLHIKAFAPRYLEVCDELGMLLHCDIPIAEPIAHDELDDDTELARRCIAAATEQVRRDRSHPSIVLWSAMNELCYDRREARQWDGYERFARAVATTIAELDPTRPVIENDWPEPDPDRVFVSDVLTAHWYGRLHAEYLDKIERQSASWRDIGRPLFVTEFGDWGLPEMPKVSDPPFWDPREIYAAGLAATLWPGTVDRFAAETQRYQGLSDRLQIEVFRRHDHIGGYCLTELTDVPHELNGLLDLNRKRKEIAVAEVRRANQAVLPMLALRSLVVEQGAELRADVHIANDGPPMSDVSLEVLFGDTIDPASVERLLSTDTSSLPLDLILARFDRDPWGQHVGELAGHRPTHAGEASLTAPDVPGGHDLLVRLAVAGRVIAENRYPIHVVVRGPVDDGVRVRAHADDPAAAALSAAGVPVADDGPLVIGEDRLDESRAADAIAALSRGETVILLAHAPEAFEHAPVPMRAALVETAWGSSVFHFTTGAGALASFPRRQLLVAEDSTIQARTAVVEVEGSPFPTLPIVIAYKPNPGAMTATIVGEHRVGAGRLVFCQYRLVEGSLRGDAAAKALLRDLARWACAPRRPPERLTVRKDDGRELHLYRLEERA